MAPVAELVTLAEYDARIAAGERLEYDGGVVLEMPLNDSVHDGIKLFLSGDLNRQLPPPAIACAEVTFELGPGQIKVPDVAVLLKRRPRVPGQRFQGAPDLVIEIVSKSDTAWDVNRRISQFLEAGARAVWVIWPDTKDLDVHEAGNVRRRFQARDVLTGEEPIPQYRLDLAALCAGY